MKIRKAVFPVAGLGTRVLPATKAMPKEMLTIVDRPLIQYVVDEAQGSRHRAFHLRHRPQQGRDRGPFRPHVRTRRHAGRARQEGRDRNPGALPAGSRRHQLHPPAGAARARPRGVVRPRHRRQRAVRGGAAGRTGAEHAGLPRPDDRGRRQARRQIQRDRGRRRAGTPDPSIRHLRRRQAPWRQDVRGRRHGGEAAARAPRPPISRSPGATSCSRRSSRSWRPRSAAPAAKSSSPTP